MSALILALDRFQSQTFPVQQSHREPRQFDLPLYGLRVLRVVARWLTPRRPCERIVYFGKSKQFVCIGTMVRRVGA